MIFISHRGNINGPIKNLENNPNYILEALSKGFNCELDIHMVEGQLYLGHDTPEYKVTLNFLNFHKEKLWIHCKNIDSILFFNKLDGYNYFWHEEDKITLTSKNHIWAYPGKQPIFNSVSVMPEIHNELNLDLCKGICSDFIQKYKDFYEKK